MPDRKQDQFDLPSDFDFDAIAKYESDGTGSKAVGSDVPEFETSSEADFTSFGSNDFDDSTSNVDFGSQDFGAAEDLANTEFGGGDFDFGGPPSPQSVELESLHGNPDEEFGDFGGDDTPSDPFEPDDDALPAKGYSAGATADPFEPDDEGSVAEEGVASPAKENSKASIKHYAGIAAVVAVVGFVGYTQVIPMFVSTDSGQVVADTTAPVIVSGNLPASLPPVSTNVKPPEVIAAIPEVTASPPTGGASSATLPTPSLNLSGTSPSLAATPAVGNAPSLALPSASAPSVTTPVKVDPLDEMVGGTDRGGLSSMKDEATTRVAAPTPNADIAAIAARLDEVVKRIDAIEHRVASFGAAFDGNGETKTPITAAKPAATIPAVVTGSVSAPLKPPIIENVVLRGVSRDTAWIATSNGVVQVKVGDSVAEAGVVESFQNYRGRWIAVTDKGIILPR
jgi:hypothetical protein